jgi:hypothetical protein
MADVTITRSRPNTKPGRHVVRGAFTFPGTDTEAVIRGLPKGNVIGFRAIAVGSAPTPVSVALVGTLSNGLLACDGTLTVKRSAGTDSGGAYFFEVEYDSN